MGRRVVDIMHVFEQIQNSRHIGGFGCSFLDMEFDSERREGYVSLFKFSCKMCNIDTTISSEKRNSTIYMPLNEAIVSGTIASGIGYSQLAELSAFIDIPYMSNTTYSLVSSKMSTQIHQAALEEMKKAAEEEKELALKAGDVDEDGIPMCTVVADGQWAKRSYKTKYDALSGAVSLFDYN